MNGKIYRILVNLEFGRGFTFNLTPSSDQTKQQMAMFSFVFVPIDFFVLHRYRFRINELSKIFSHYSISVLQPDLRRKGYNCLMLDVVESAPGGHIDNPDYLSTPTCNTPASGDYPGCSYAFL